MECEGDTADDEVLVSGTLKAQQKSLFSSRVLPTLFLVLWDDWLSSWGICTWGLEGSFLWKVFVGEVGPRGEGEFVFGCLGVVGHACHFVLAFPRVICFVFKLDVTWDTYPIPEVPAYGQPTPPIKATRVTFVGKCTGCKSNRRLSHCSGHPGSRHWNWGHSWQLGRPDREYSGLWVFPPVFKLHYGTYDATSLIMTLLVHWFLTLFVFFKRKSYPF